MSRRTHQGGPIRQAQIEQLFAQKGEAVPGLGFSPDLRFYCTDCPFGGRHAPGPCGQHPKTTLGTASPFTGSAGGYLWLSKQRKPGVGFDGYGVWLETREARHRTVHIRCPRCRRHVPWREENANRIVTAALAAGLREVDICHM